MTAHGEITAPYRAALQMIREAIGELFGPTANLESEEATLLRGPEPHHEAEAIIAALQNIHHAIGSDNICNHEHQSQNSLDEYVCDDCGLLMR